MRPHPFAALPPTAATSFSLHGYAAILRVLSRLFAAFGSQQEAFDHFPFVTGYVSEVAAIGLEGMALPEAEAWWREELTAWEAAQSGHLPLAALKAAGLSYDAILLLLTIGLIDEDARFGPLFEFLQNRPGEHRPTLGLLDQWGRDEQWRDEQWRDDERRDDEGGRERAQEGSNAGRAALRTLQSWGLIQLLNPTAPRLEWTFEIPALLWDALHGNMLHSDTLHSDMHHSDMHHSDALSMASWLHLRPHATLTPLAALIAPDSLLRQVATLPALLQSGQLRTVIVRGPQHNGRRTLLGALAHKLQRAMLVIEAPRQTEDARWRGVGALVTLLGAMPVMVVEVGPGESALLPQLPGYHGPIGVVMGKQGAVDGPEMAHAVTLVMELPDPAAREQHWQAALRQAGFSPENNTENGTENSAQLGSSLRMTSGNLRRTAKLAVAVAALEGRTTITPLDLRQASRALYRQTLETLATYLPAAGNWRDLAVSSETQRDLEELEVRCRFREQLHQAMGMDAGRPFNPGVRALMSGPSGTGKTLAARLLASALNLDLYRVDLSSVVNKYIGETEKNLNQLFTRAEELDVILLLDEGDALLTQRTQVQSSNDRYANLETNYLLQRIEQFEGILLVTTNAGDRIDRAFQRRMDVVIDFRPPDAQERWAIWQIHLPPGHQVEDAFLQEIATRCTLTGGQIRNAALHAALLALNEDSALGSDQLERAIQREYRKAGTICPLRPPAAYTMAGRAMNTHAMMWG